MRKRTRATAKHPETPRNTPKHRGSPDTEAPRTPDPRSSGARERVRVPGPGSGSGLRAPGPGSGSGSRGPGAGTGSGALLIPPHPSPAGCSMPAKFTEVRIKFQRYLVHYFEVEERRHHGCGHLCSDENLFKNVVIERLVLETKLRWSVCVCVCLCVCSDLVRHLVTLQIPLCPGPARTFLYASREEL